MTRRTTTFVALLAALLLLVVASASGAQAPADSIRSWIVRVAGATGAEACPCHSPSLHVPHDRELYIVGVGMRKVLRSQGPDGFEVAYDLQFLPLIISHGTADENLRIGLCKGNAYCADITSASPWTTRAAGIGVLPLGFTALAPIIPRLRFQLRAAAGAIRLSRPVPVLEGRKFNFLAEASTSFEIRVSPTFSLTAGMVFNHISNGGTADINPGMNSRMLEFGIVRR
jgi:hypothetical protein